MMMDGEDVLLNLCDVALKTACVCVPLAIVGAMLTAGVYIGYVLQPPKEDNRAPYWIQRSHQTSPMVMYAMHQKQRTE